MTTCNKTKGIEPYSTLNHPNCRKNRHTLFTHEHTRFHCKTRDFLHKNNVFHSTFTVAGNETYINMFKSTNDKLLKQNVIGHFNYYD